MIAFVSMNKDEKRSYAQVLLKINENSLHMHFLWKYNHPDSSFYDIDTVADP